MYSVLLVIHLIVTVCLIIIILAQRSASDGMGLSGSSSTSFLSGRSAASAVTRTTGILAGLFIVTSLGLGILTARSHGVDLSMMQRIAAKQTSNGVTVATPGKTTPVAPQTSTPSVPATPAKPSVPRPE